MTKADGKKQSDEELLSSVKEEMAKPRETHSVRAEESAQALAKNKRNTVSTDGHGSLVATKATILLVDDHKIARRHLRRLLEEHAGWLVCCEAENGKEAVEKFNELLPDLTVMDFQMPEMNGLEAARLIIQHHSDAAILMLSVHTGAQMIAAAKEAGIKGFCPKSEMHCILDAVTVLLAGETFFQISKTPSEKAALSPV